MKHLWRLNSSLAALAAVDPTTVDTASTLIPWLLAAAAAVIVAALVILDLRNSRWWKLRSGHGVATVYLFYKHGERLNLAALRAFEQAEDENRALAEFFNCELPFHAELAEQFGVKTLPTIVIHWERLCDGELCSHTERQSITESKNLAALMRESLTNAPELATPG